jgi:class 3 adenylate cyclase
MRRALREIGKLETSGGRVQLRMSVGLHSGTFHLFLVGGSHREFMITGPGATQTAAMEGTAEAGEILVSPATAALLPAKVIGAAKGPGFLLRGDPGGLTPAPMDPEIRVPGELIERCISRATREHLLFGTGEPEHRRVVVGFLHFDGTDEMIELDGSAVFAEALDELVRDVQDAVDEQGVCFLGTDVDKDGGKIILTAGAPISTENDEERMLIAGLRIMQGNRRIPIRMGINRGHVFAGDIGPAYRRTYTVMGDAVNLASRLENANKIYGTHSLASEPAIVAAGDAVEVREIDRLVVVGQTKPEAVFEIMGRNGELGEKLLALRERYAEGLAAYRARRWDEAQHAFRAALEAVPGDGPSLALAKRVEEFQAHPPVADWDGAWRLDQK